MRCRVCGYEVGSDATHCPMCGSKITPVAKVVSDSELSWNTKDFPKPKEMEDIKMSWPDLNARGSHAVPVPEEKIEEALDKKETLSVMSKDASEGYVSMPSADAEKEAPKEEAKPAEAAKPAAEAPRSTMEVRTAGAEDAKPAAEKEDAPSYWYTQKFTATGIMQTGPAWPVAPGSTRPAYPAKATIESMTLSDPLPIADQTANKAKAPGFTLNDLLEEYGDPKLSEDDKTATRTYVNRSSLDDTLQAKNDAFQKLLDQEYDRLHAMHGENALKDLLDDNRFVPDESVKAKDLSTFEKMLLEADPAPVDDTPAHKFFSAPAADEAAETAPDLAALVAHSGDPSKYDINHIENTIRDLQKEEELAEQRRKERLRQLAEMAAARDAYFSTINAEKDKEEEHKIDEAKVAAAFAAGRDTSESDAPAAASIADASPVSLWDDNDMEPTKEIPVGSILKALAAGGAVAAVEKSVEAAAKPAEAPAAAAEPVKTAAMAVAPIASIKEDLSKTIVVRRSLTEEAEERAKLYEDAVEPEPIKTAAKHVVEPIANAAAELARKYETAAEEDNAKSDDEIFEEAADILDNADDAAAAAEEAKDAAAAEEAKDDAAAAAEEVKAEAAAVAKVAPEQTDPEDGANAAPIRIAAALAAAASMAKVSEKATAEAAADDSAADASPVFTAENDAADDASFIAGLADADDAAADAVSANAAADAVSADAANADDAEDAVRQAEETAKKAEAQAAAVEKELGADVDDARARIAAAIAAATAASAATDSAAPADDAADSAAEDASKDDVLSEAFAANAAVDEPTHPFDAADVKDAAGEDGDDGAEDAAGEDIEESKPKHIFLKIIAIILLICAIFEGAVFGLKKLAPDAQITQNAIQIEQGIGDALTSLYDTVYNAIQNIFGGN